MEQTLEPRALRPDRLCVTGRDKLLLEWDVSAGGFFRSSFDTFNTNREVTFGCMNIYQMRFRSRDFDSEQIAFLPKRIVTVGCFKLRL